MSVELVTPSLSFVGRANMPSLNTGTTTSTSTSSTGTTTGSSSSANSGTTSSTGMPKVGTSSTGMPSLGTTTSSQAYTTPSVGVPAVDGNPYISRTSQPSGTVFIAVGSVVAVILLVFALFHLFKSLTASSLAKKAVDSEKFAYQKFAHNNNVAYGGSHRASNSTLFNSTEYKGSVSKLPLMNSSQFAMGGSFGNDRSSPALSDSERATSHHDLTTMFVSPTKEMTSNRLSSHNFSNSVGNVSMYGRSATDITHVPASNKHASTVPNYYMNESFNNSEYNLTPEANARAPGERKPRNPIPSMYLEDLIDN